MRHYSQMLLLIGSIQLLTAGCQTKVRQRELPSNALYFSDETMETLERVRRKMGGRSITDTIINAVGDYRYRQYQKQHTCRRCVDGIERSMPCEESDRIEKAWTRAAIARIHARRHQHQQTTTP